MRADFLDNIEGNRSFIMGNKRTWLLYGIYGVAVTAFFLYLLFPIDAVKNATVNQIRHRFPLLQATIGQAHLVLPPGLRFDNVSVLKQKRPYFDASRVILRADWLSLIRGRQAITYDIDAAGGRIEGRADIGGDQLNLIGEMERVRLEDVPALQAYIPLGISGVLNGKITYLTEPDNKQSANLRINVSDCIVQLEEPFLNIDILRFTSIDADAQLDNQQLKLTRFVFKGDELNGDLSGTGILRNTINKSSLNLSGKLQPNAALLKQVGGDLAVNFLKGAGPGGLPIRISGSFDSPKVSFR